MKQVAVIARCEYMSSCQLLINTFDSLGDAFMQALSTNNAGSPQARTMEGPSLHPVSSLLVSLLALSERL